MRSLSATGSSIASLLLLVLPAWLPGCMGERNEGSTARQPQDSRTGAKPQPDTPVPASEGRAAEEPEVLNDEVFAITAEQARAKGLSPLGFSLDFRGSGMTVTPFFESSYLHASGPPGGPLGLRISPVAADAELAGAVAAGSELIHEQVELLGRMHRAAAWIEGQSHARTAWCAVIVAPEQGDHALLLELGVGHQGDEITCKTALGHPTLAKVIASLSFAR